MSLLLLLRNWPKNGTPLVRGPNAYARAYQLIPLCYSVEVVATASAKQASATATAKAPEAT